MDQAHSPATPAFVSFGLQEEADGLFLMRLEQEKRQQKRRLVAALVAFFFVGQAFVAAVATGVRWAKVKVPLAQKARPAAAYCP